VREVASLATDYRSTRLSVDVYCLQHSERYCVSAKSLAAHLTGLAWSQERDGSIHGLQVLQRWLDSPGELQKPGLPAGRGDLTVQQVVAANGPEDYAVRLAEWAASTWAAYDALHEVARAWIELAFATRRT
jgi:hypothetical protein